MNHPKTIIINQDVLKDFKSDHFRPDFNRLHQRHICKYNTMPDNLYFDMSSFNDFFGFEDVIQIVTHLDTTTDLFALSDKFKPEHIEFILKKWGYRFETVWIINNYTQVFDRDNKLLGFSEIMLDSLGRYIPTFKFNDSTIREYEFNYQKRIGFNSRPNEYFVLKEVRRQIFEEYGDLVKSSPR